LRHFMDYHKYRISINSNSALENAESLKQL
jgi:hypothetical protein